MLRSCRDTVSRSMPACSGCPDSIPTTVGPTQLVQGQSDLSLSYHLCICVSSRTWSRGTQRLCCLSLPPHDSPRARVYQRGRCGYVTERFICIPQHGPASLDVTAAASIVLHHFAVWAGYAAVFVLNQQGNKYVCCLPPSPLHPLSTQGQGLSEKQMRLCDGFIYIPQHGPGTASLNVTVAASIVLHHFAVWAGYAERQREGAKFVVDPRPQRTTPRGVVPLTEQEQEALRLQRQGAGVEEGEGEGGEEWLQQAMEQHGGVDGLLEAVTGSVGGSSQ
jgi:hypothetical protein